MNGQKGEERLPSDQEAKRRPMRRLHICSSPGGGSALGPPSSFMSRGTNRSARPILVFANNEKTEDNHAMNDVNQ